MFVREMQFRLARGVPFCEIVQATAVQCLTLKTVTQMHLSLVFWIAIAVFVCYQIWIRNRDGAIVHAIRTTKAINAVMAAYRGGDYRTALQRAESLKDGSSNTAEYCFFRGSCCIILESSMTLNRTCEKAWLLKPTLAKGHLFTT